MTQQKDDCYFFYYSTCVKGMGCPFRHEPAALGREDTCPSWLKGACQREACPDRHMIINKNRTQTPCFWESQPGGCQKPHCVFFHKRSTIAIQQKSPVSQEPVQKGQPVGESVAGAEKTVPSEVETKPEKPLVASGSRPQVVGVATGVQRAMELPSVAVDKAPPTREAMVPAISTGGVRKVRTCDEDKVVPQPTKKVILKEESAKKHVTERVKPMSKEGDGIVIKSLEQIHREKALASMKKKQQDGDAAEQQNGEGKISPVGRKIVIKREMKSEGEISDDSDVSQPGGRKVEAKSDTEGSQARPVEDVVVPRLSCEGESLKRVRIEPLLALPGRKRPAGNDRPAPLRLYSKVARLAMRGEAKPSKPEMKIYRPPTRAANLAKKDPQQTRVSPKSEEDKPRTKEDALTKKRVHLLTLLSKAPEEKKKSIASSVLLKKPKAVVEREERRPLEEVKVKTLDEILAEKRKKNPIHQTNGRAEGVIPSSTASDKTKGLTVEALRTIRRKRAVPERAPMSGSEHSLSHLLKRRRVSVENARVVPDIKSRVEVASGSRKEEEVEVSPPVEEPTEQSTKGDASLSFGIDDESFDDFLLGTGGSDDAFIHHQINDDELFKEIQSLL